MDIQEIRELKDQLNSVEIKIEAAPGPDLMGMIDEIRAQYEKLAAQNKLEAEDMIKARVAKASEQAKKDGEQIRDMKDQIGEYRKTVQTLHMEIDSLRSAVSIFLKLKRKKKNRFSKNRPFNRDPFCFKQLKIEEVNPFNKLFEKKAEEQALCQSMPVEMIM